MRVINAASVVSPETSPQKQHKIIFKPSRAESEEQRSFALASHRMGADHYRRAQHDARISAGAFANNLILPGLICCWSAPFGLTTI